MGTLPRTATVDTTVSAGPQQVWDVLTDIARAGEWSHETRGGAWLDGEVAAVPGARFRGHNGKGFTRWSRTCEIEEAEPPSLLVWRTIPTKLYPDSTRWRVEIAPVEGGTRVTQRFDILYIHPFFDRLYHAVIPAHRDRRAALTEDLRRLGEVAARSGHVNRA